jgi:carbon monoxide dehydrogenase subunit G
MRGSVRPVQIGGTKQFGAPPERVYDALVDPQLLSDFLPGIESLDVHDDTHWSALMRLPRAPVSLRLEFELKERRRPEWALLTAAGKRLGASASAQTSFELAERDGGTEMAWAAEVELGGTLRGLNSMLRPVAQQQAEKFLDRLDKRLE